MSTISNEVLEKLSVRYRLLAKIHDGSESKAWEESALIVEELLALRKEREKEESAVCPKCGNTGLADSGGVQPWGEPILIECDCTAPPAPTDKPKSEMSQQAEQLLRDTTALAVTLSAETDTTSQHFESLAFKSVVPEGWKLVPIELTKEMLKQIHPFAEATCLDCGNQVVAHCADNVTASWNDMLAVAPEPCK
ncbi:hypothetical protein C3D71_08475 [Cronobacter sakazakii]|uniref:hypothetical protein n=1 Tax=Cronobacter sakazakii TaxID=28141 RepID=UPI000D3B0BDF|nr:hypothetical protein [Cronobacter sakazakii]PUE78402.1 hypothetical protein C3D71_08475 [Cronobacter sakazakii]